ncbi:alpha-1,3-arabinosyltransferase XAT3 [Oryza brachyantha]|uniref:Glycosyltransferase 61 catalytic domain-containing protein n=1 Tax=Oryza brachyantha TaxID=4533 RepID=J3ME36_ORYBR|nr:alpha-1,3-arabinosyltransferase XAT3 [Oryza brachyantha]
MKAGERPKLVRGLRQESRRFRLLVIVLGFFLVSLTFVFVSKPDAILFGLNGKLPVNQAPTSILIQQKVNDEAVGEPRKTSTDALRGDPKVVDDEADVKPKGTGGGGGEEEEAGGRVLSEPDPTSGMMEPTHNKDGNGHKSDEETLGGGGDGKMKGKEEEEEEGEGEHVDQKHKVTLPTVSNYTIHDAAEDTENAKQEDNVQQGSKPLCDFSNFRANVCEMRGDVRIHPAATSVLFMEPDGSQRDEVWKIKPYPRKGDEFCLSHITELTVKSSKVAPECTKYHDVPVIIFSLTGYTGNLFHDFTDVMVPLFTTASEFNGEVEFLITDMALWWTIKYQTVLQKLTKYPVIDFSKDDQVHCVKHAIVGLHAYMEFTIDSTKAPHNYSMVDFNRFMRGAYSLDRDSVTVLGQYPKIKPRLLIIKRHRTRMFLNLDEIIAMAEELGFEVVIDEANVSSDISRFARLVNSVDVMMGIHGAGLTNCVFLPQNGTLIQIVPWGGLDWISRTDFGNPAELMGLRYKQYSISVDESSLTDQYPRDHEIFKNPISFHKRGFDFIRQTFMENQNVRLDCKRFRPILLEALDNLHP